MSVGRRSFLKGAAAAPLAASEIASNMTKSSSISNIGEGIAMGNVYASSDVCSTKMKSTPNPLEKIIRKQMRELDNSIKPKIDNIDIDIYVIKSTSLSYKMNKTQARIIEHNKKHRSLSNKLNALWNNLVTTDDDDE